MDLDPGRKEVNKDTPPLIQECFLHFLHVWMWWLRSTKLLQVSSRCPQLHYFLLSLPTINSILVCSLLEKSTLSHSLSGSLLPSQPLSSAVLTTNIIKPLPEEKKNRTGILQYAYCIPFCKGFVRDFHCCQCSLVFTKPVVTQQHTWAWPKGMVS